jgi:dTDP-4-amino-4,6-dideoxygalactose transaminase
MGQNRRVPFVDLRAPLQDLRTEIDAAIRRTLDSTDFVLGKQLTEFEDEFARYCDCQHAIGVSSGTAALHLILVALGITRGDEVITVPNTFVATVEAILYTGATPVFADVDERTYCIDPAAIERAITPRTKAILPVHIFGQPCDMESVTKVARRHGVEVVEDACQAHGATFMGRKVGSLGRAAAFSFYPTKNLGAIGDAGAITTNDGELARKLRALRHHAQYEPNVFSAVGHNYRLDTLQGAVLSVKLRRLDEWNERRRTIASRYRKNLKGSDFRFQESVPGAVSSYHILTVQHPKRSAVQEFLNNAGIGWGRHIVPPVHEQPAYRHLVRNGEQFPVSERLSRELVSLPVYPSLTDDQVDHVTDVLSKVEVSV